MDDGGFGLTIGFFAGIVVGLFIWGNMGVYLAQNSAAEVYAKQHCEAKCAPTTPHFTAKLEGGKFTCTCLVTP
jgi:hypothetical protein